MDLQKNQQIQKKISDLIHYKKIHNLPTSITKREIKLLKKDMPIQKIVGFINFDNLQINVHKKVLIPRYETQEVVNKAKEFLTLQSKVLDLGCGSGYIGLTIKKQIDCDVTLSDIDRHALKQTTINARFNHLQVKIVKSDLFTKINDKFDLIICNPPYIPDRSQLAKSVVNFEPRRALFGGQDGNEYYRKIIEKIADYLNKNGVVVFEISDDNEQYLIKQGFTIFNDINNKSRIAVKKY